MKDNFDLYSWNKNRYLDKENKSKETKNKNFDLYEWNKKRYLGELDINTMGGETNVDNVDVTHGGDDPKIGAEEESDANVVGENQSHLEFLSKYLEKMYPELRFEVRFGERIDAYGSQQDLADFGNKMHGKKFGDEYEVFHIDDDDRGEIVRIVKSDSIMRGKLEEGVVKDMHTFLNDLRDSGVTNMFGAAPYLQKEFGIDQKSARQVLANWMQSFDENLDEELTYKDRKLSHEEEDRLDLIAHREFDGVSFSKLSDEDKAKVFAQRDKVGVKEQIKETIRFIKENNPEFTTEEIAAELKEIKALGEKLEETMCKRGQNYMAARKRAGEKSSAYLSGRGVKVCKGQIKGSDGKKKKSFESLNEVNNSDIVKALAKAVDMEPKDVVAKIKASKDEVNEIAVTTAITIAGLLPAAMELVGGAFNKAKNSFKLNEKERTEYLALQQFYKEAKDKEEKKRLKKEMEPYESKIGNWFKDAGHSLHKAYTAPIRGLLWMASKLAPKDSSLKDKEKREKIANVIYAAAMIGIAGYGVASHIGHLKGVSDVAITIADSIKGGKSIKDATLGGLELLGLL